MSEPATVPTGLLTDRYELTMLDAARRNGTADRRSVFEVFGRRLSGGRRYGVVAGTGRLLEAVDAFRFDDAALAFLEREQVVGTDTLAWLADFRFRGDVDGYPEGEVWFPHSPLLTIEGTFAEAVLLETLVLSVLNHDCAVATAASRMTAAAGERPCLDMGARRTHEVAAVAAARAAYVGGFASTSSLAAHRDHGVPSVGTSAHSFTLLHDTEEEAFAAQVAAQGAGTTLLVDTYDVPEAVRTAVRVAGPGLGAVRLDSGDLGELAHQVRAQLDDLGATGTRIVVTSDLDEHAIAALAAAPVDAYGVGTRLVTGSGHPTAGLVYKLVACEDADGSWRPVAKTSPDKVSAGGRKQASRRYADGVAAEEVVRVGAATRHVADDERTVTVPLVRRGEVVGAETLDEARARHLRTREELPATARRLSRGDPALPTRFVGGPPTTGRSAVTR